VVIGPTDRIECNAKFRYYISWDRPFTIKFQSAPNPLGTTYLWDFGDGSTSNVAHPGHQFPDTGLYTICLTVTATYSNGTVCTNKSCMKIYINGPIIRNPDAPISVYPNPATTNVTFSLSTIQNAALIQLYNYKGEVVLVKEKVGNGIYNFDTQAIEPGIYYYRVVEGGSILSTGKLMIQ
jgi:PKD repeat protein